MVWRWRSRPVDASKKYNQVNRERSELRDETSRNNAKTSEILAERESNLEKNIPTKMKHEWTVLIWKQLDRWWKKFCSFEPSRICHEDLGVQVVLSVLTWRAWTLRLVEEPESLGDPESLASKWQGIFRDGWTCDLLARERPTIDGCVVEMLRFGGNCT